MPADCEARFYGDRRWYPATRVVSEGGPKASTQHVLFVGFEGDGPQETQARDVRKLGWGRGSATGGHSSGSNRRFIELNRQLMNAPDPAALVQLVEGHAAEFNQVNATTALQRLAKAGTVGAEASAETALGLLVARTAELLKHPVGGAWEPRQLSTAMWGLARLRLASGVGPTAAQRQLADALGAAAVPVALARRFRPQEIANSVWAVARLGQCAPDLLAALADGAAAQVQDFTAQGLSNAVWGMATLGSVHAGLMAAVAGAVRQRVAEFNAQEVSNTLWAFAKLEPKLRGTTAERSPHEVMQAVVRVLPQLLSAQPCADGGLTEQHMANLAWAVAHLGDRGDATGELQAAANPGAVTTVDFPALFVRPIAQRAGACNARELAMVAWAAATAATGEAGAAAVTPAFDAIGESVVSILASSRSAAGSAADEAETRLPFSPGQLSTFVWAFARLRIPAPALMEAVSREVCPTLEKFSWHDLSLLLWAYARLQCKVPKLMAKAARLIRRRLKKETKAASGPSTDGPPRDVSGSETAQAQPSDGAHNDGPALAPDFEGQPSLSSSPTVKSRHLATLIWSFGTMEVQDDRLVRSVAAASLPRLDEFSPRDLANMAWGFATLGSLGATAANGGPHAPVSAVKDLLRGLAQTGGARMADFTAQESSQFLWACDKAGVGDEPALAAATRERRARTFDFPAITGVGPLGSTPGEVTITWQPAGRGLAHTGLAPWDASYVLAEWMSRFPCPASAPALRQLLGAEIDGGTWQNWGSRNGVELGAGVGLLSIVAARLGVSMIATDGDDAVLDLLRENVSRQPWTKDPAKEEHVRVRQLKWGAPDVLESLGLQAPAGLVLATGVVYGGDPEGWAGLVDSMIQLSDQSTLVLLAHGQGAAPGLHRTEGPFFDRVAEHFDYAPVPLHTLHPSYRRSGCVIHALRRRASTAASGSTRANRDGGGGGGLAALDGEQGKRAKRKRPATATASAGGGEVADARVASELARAHSVTEKSKKMKRGKKDNKRGKKARKTPQNA